MIGFVLEGLSDPEFYLGIVAVLAALLVPFSILRRKKLSFDVVCEARLLRSEGSDPEQAARTGDAAERMLFVIDLHGAVGDLTGGIGGDSAPAQHQGEVSLGFGEKARVLEADVVEERPHGIGAKARIEGSREEGLVLEAVPASRGGLVRLEVVVKNPAAEPDVFWVGGGVRYVVKVEGDIVGIRKIQKRWDSRKLLVYAFLAGLLAVLLDYSVLGWARGLLTGNQRWLLGPPSFLLGVQVAFVGIAGILLILAFAKDKRSREITDRLVASYPIAERKPRMGWP